MLRIRHRLYTSSRAAGALFGYVFYGGPDGFQ